MTQHMTKQMTQNNSKMTQTMTQRKQNNGSKHDKPNNSNHDSQKNSKMIQHDLIILNQRLKIMSIHYSQAIHKMTQQWLNNDSIDITSIQNMIQNDSTHDPNNDSKMT